MPASAARRAIPSPRSKLAAAWLSLLLGVFGAHWWYLGRRHAWLVTTFSLACLLLTRQYPSWWDNPAFLLLILPILDGFIEALVFALKPDAWFDARYNPEHPPSNRSGWGAVVVAMLTTLVGGATLMFWIAMIVMHVYEQMGWLDGYVY